MPYLTLAAPASLVPPTLPFKDALAAFLVKLTEMVEAHRLANFPSIPATVFTVSSGGVKFLRIVRESVGGHDRSVYCFVGVADGGVYKAASWKAPAKSARGSIYNRDPLTGCGPYGPAYLK